MHCCCGLARTEEVNGQQINGSTYWAVLQNRNGHWLTQTLMSSHASWGTYSQVFHCHVLEIFQVFPFCLHFGETIAFVYRGRVAECRGLPVGCTLPQLRKQKLSTQTCKNAAGNGIYEKAWWIGNVYQSYISLQSYLKAILSKFKPNRGDGEAIMSWKLKTLKSFRQTKCSFAWGCNPMKTVGSLTFSHPFAWRQAQQMKFMFLQIQSVDWHLCHIFLLIEGLWKVKKLVVHVQEPSSAFWLRFRLILC